MKTITTEQELPVATTQALPVAAASIAIPKPIQILQSAIQAGITAENFPIVKELMAMCRDEQKFESKVQFNRAFFELRQELGGMNFYADKAATNNNGKVAYTYCSERELSAGLEPVLFKHGFAMLFGQGSEDGKIVAKITLMHKDGHEETREYAVRSGNTNAMKDATAADTGAATSAWRHLVIKMFGLKSRICEEDDARNLGDLAKKITTQQCEELTHRFALLNKSPQKILEYVGAKTMAEIPAAMYPVADRMLAAMENPK